MKSRSAGLFSQGIQSRLRANHTSQADTVQLQLVVSALRQFPRQHAALLCFGSSILILVCLGVFTISSSAASSRARITFGLCTEKNAAIKFCSGSIFGVYFFFGTRCPILYVLHILTLFALVISCITLLYLSPRVSLQHSHILLLESPLPPAKLNSLPLCNNK